MNVYPYFSLQNLILGLLIFLAACTATSTNFTGSWKSPDLDKQKSYDNIFVAALTQNMNAKEIVEGELVALLEQQGINATTSLSLFPNNFSAEHASDKRLILDKVKANGNDAILAISLVDQTHENRFVGGNDTYAPTLAYGYYDNFHTYYSYNYSQIYTPGYYSLDKIYYLETNLYDVENEKLYWSAQSDTYNPGDIEYFAEDFSKAIIAQLKREGLIEVE